MSKDYELTPLDELHMQVQAQHKPLYTINKPLMFMQLANEEYVSVSESDQVPKYYFNHLTPKKHTHILMEDYELLCDGKLWILKKEGYQELYSCPRKRRITDIESAFESTLPNTQEPCIVIAKKKKPENAEEQELLIYVDESLQLLGCAVKGKFRSFPKQLPESLESLTPNELVNEISDYLFSRMHVQKPAMSRKRVMDGTWKKVN